MKNSKAQKITFWLSTTIIFLFEGVMPALFSQTEMAVEGITHLGYPLYFGNMLTVFKVIGALILILPFAKSKLKEWAYAGFTFVMISAFVSHVVVDGFTGQSFFPLIILAILGVSYCSYHKAYGDKK